MITYSASNAELLHIEDDKDWVNKARDFAKHHPDRHRIIVADNAERGYFRQGLFEMGDAEYIQLQDSIELTTQAAQRLVGLCRGELRGTLFVVLSNNDLFLLALDDAIEAQHSGLMTVTELPLPGGHEKETIVRVNTNRLNRVSYWYCLDKAGPQEKIAVKRALEGASTFPESFAAVNNALATASLARVGRPARQNYITLICLVPDDEVSSFDATPIGPIERTELEHKWAAIHLFNNNWCPAPIPERERKLLESEWKLRLVLVGKAFVAALSAVKESGDSYATACADFLEVAKRVHGPGTQESTHAKTREDFIAAIDSWPDTAQIDLDDFWGKGQTRSGDYEDSLRKVLPGYDTGSAGFLGHRPDYVVTPFQPCSILGATSEETQAINAAIRRTAHVFEFTASNELSTERIASYLGKKMSAYVNVTQEQ